MLAAIVDPVAEMFRTQIVCAVNIPTVAKVTPKKGGDVNSHFTFFVSIL